METILIVVLAAAAAAGGGFIAGWQLRQARLRAARATAEDEAARILDGARGEAERLRKSEVLAGKEEALRAREEWDREEARRRDDVERIERRLLERQETLDRKLQTLDEKAQAQEERAAALGRREKEVERQGEEMASRIGEVQHRLEALAGLSAEEARRQLMHDLEEEARASAAQRLREIKEEARRDAEREAKKIISLAIQRIAADHTAETTVSVVSLPSDEMKGRIIGREGRNIRAFEQATGIDVIIDDTPEAVVLSGFDPIRRETRGSRWRSSSPTAASTPAASTTWSPRRGRRWRRGCARRRRRSCTRWACTACTRRWSRCWAGSSSAPRTGRTSSCTPRRWRCWPATWRRRWASTRSWPSGWGCCTTWGRG
jgi:ribonucrease Y